MIFTIRVILRKEKMGKQLDQQKILDSHYSKIKNNLVLSIDKNERITKFNEECEKVFGYKKNEVINRLVSDLFIPTSYLDQWKNLFEYSKINKTIDNFKLPFLTKSGQETIIYWSNFPVKNEKGNVTDIGLVGNLIKPIEKYNETIFEYPNYEPDELNIKKSVSKDKIKVDDLITKVFRKMKSKNEDLLIKNRDLEKKLNYYKNRFDYNKDKQDSNLTKSLSSISGLFGGNKKRQEYENIVHELDERGKNLNRLESDLLKEKTKINEKVNDLKVWREKLEVLNDKLEEKWNELVRRENLLIEKQSYSSNLYNNVETKSKGLKDSNELFDQIQDSAVIIQRGILRHVNSSFINLIGYNVNEIIDKSFFDFIVPEGFLNVERFYLSRLKGEDVSTYETVILTKDNNKISIEVINKPTFFNGEKAEIAIIKILNKDDKK